MNAFRTSQTAANTSATSAPSAGAVVIPMPTRHTHRERDFGIGYGNSSGYASARQYASNWAPPRFKCA